MINTAQELSIDIEATKERWRVSVRGQTTDVEVPTFGEDLVRLRTLAGAGFEVDGDGKTGPVDKPTIETLRALARRVGAKLDDCIPQVGRSALATVVGNSAVDRPGLLRIRVEGPAASEALRLPWELLSVGGRFPVEHGELYVVREAVAEGVTAGLPEDPPPLTVVAHVAAPSGPGLPELNLEEAAYRMARALDHLRENVRFTELGTLDDLVAVAKAVRPVMLYFAGHGIPGKLVFENEDAGIDEVDVTRLIGRLQGAMERLPLAVWLSCCYGAGSGTPPAAGDAARARAWGSAAAESPAIAADLHRAGVPQVLGYFGAVPDPLAVEVDRALFETLVETGSTLRAVHVARTRSRESIATRSGRRLFPLAWTLLSLYHRGPDLPLIRKEVHLGEEAKRAMGRETLKLEGIEPLQHGFIGRRRLLADLRQRLRSGVHALGLYGPGGLGKTATMTRLCSVLAGGAHGWQEQVLAIAAGTRSSACRCERGRESTWSWLLVRIEMALRLRGLLPDKWDETIAEIDEIEDAAARGTRFAQAFVAAVSGRVVFFDSVETLQADPIDPGTPGIVPWRDEETAAFFAEVCGVTQGGLRVLLTTRYRPAETRGSWLAIPPCTKDEIFRMSGWWPALNLLPSALREELAEERLAGHPRAVQWANALVDERLAGWEDVEGRALRATDDIGRVRSLVLAPALSGLPARASHDQLLHKLLLALPDAPRALLGESCAVGSPVPLAVIGGLGTGVGLLRAQGLLTRFDGALYAVHPFVRKAHERLSGGPTWTPAGRAVIAEFWHSVCVRECRSNCARNGVAPDPFWLETLGHLVAAERWEAALQVALTVDREYQRRGWVRQRVTLLDPLASCDWPCRERGEFLRAHGDALVAAGRYADAELAARESVALAERVCGGTRAHGEVAASLHGLANALVSQGRHADAESAYLESIEIQERAYGTRAHPALLPVLANLANLLMQQESRRADAVEIATEAFETAVTIKSPIDAVQCGVALCQALMVCDRRDVAMARRTEVASMLDAFPVDHPVRRSVESALQLDGRAGDADERK